MLTEPILSQRVAGRLCISESIAQIRHFGNKKGQWSIPPRRRAKPGSTQSKNNDSRPRYEAPTQAYTGPSLAEQLFPEESKLHAAQQASSREIPRLPLETPRPEQLQRREPKIEKTTQVQSWAARQLQAEMEAAGPGTAVLVLRNASPNLTEEDFRRLIPQGRHIEGWTLDQGDILKVIPRRNLLNLQHDNVYYLLFSSALSAFTYQGHATRIHRLADAYTPTSMTTSIPPPPGYLVEGIDLHTAIQAYALVPPGEKLELRQLRPPYSPLMQAIIRHQGFPQIIKRKDKSPYEVRLTMEGPQLPFSIVRHIFMESGKARGLTWSGGENMNLDIRRWEAKENVSPQVDTFKVRNTVKNAEDGKEEPVFPWSKEVDPDTQKIRPPPVVYVVGFHTEKAAVSFTQYWHRRPLEIATQLDHDHFEGDLPPIANVQLL